MAIGICEKEPNNVQRSMACQIKWDEEVGELSLTGNSLPLANTSLDHTGLTVVEFPQSKAYSEMIPAYSWALLAALLVVSLAQIEPVSEKLDDSGADEDKRTPLGTMRFGKRAVFDKTDESFLDGDKLSFDDIYNSLVREARSPLGTMRFGKRSGGGGGDRALGTMRFGKRETDPLQTMRFGKRSQSPFSRCVMKNLSWRPMLACRNTMRFGKRDPLGTMRFGRK